MKKFLGFIVLLGILAGLFYTNPTEKEHRAKMETVWGDALRQTVTGTSEGIFGGFIGNKIAGMAVKGLSDYHNYYIFSTTEIDGTITSFGICKFVYCGTSDQVKQAIVDKVNESLSK